MPAEAADDTAARADAAASDRIGESRRRPAGRMQVERREKLSFLEFFVEYALQRRPVIITDAVATMAPRSASANSPPAKRRRSGNDEDVDRGGDRHGGGDAADGWWTIADVLESAGDCRVNLRRRVPHSTEWAKLEVSCLPFSSALVLRYSLRSPCQSPELLS